MNKTIKALVGILAGFMIISASVLADSGMAVLETYTGDSDISVYVKGMDASSENISVQIATTQADQVSIDAISELEVPMQTLVMIDNSLSIPSADRDRISEFLQNLISDRLGNEEICIAVFSEDVEKLTDYTSDYTTLKKAIDGIAYQDQETYLTDVLYDLLSTEYIQTDEDVYRRIIVVSDGVDNKSLGYTKDELYALLKDIRIPIYTIGCANNKNNEELENMFALSRMTYVEYFVLEEISDLLDITTSLKQDREICRVRVKPSEELMDGSKKTIKITLQDSTALTVEMLMPQQVYVSEPDEPAAEEAVKEEPAVGNDSEAEAAAPVEPEQANTNFLSFLIIGIIAVLIIAIIVVVILIILNKKKSKEPEFEAIDDNMLQELQNSIGNVDGKTEILSSFQHKNNDDGNTVMIWNEKTAYQVVLTDVNLPSKSFQVPLEQSIVVGRKKELCDIALDYEKSVSGKHCEISVRDGKFYVKDLQSSNHTYLNGSIVLTETEIVSGNILKFGRLEMRFEVK